MKDSTNDHKHIVVLSVAEGNIVARLESMGLIEGYFRQIPTGEIFFNYSSDEDRRWYVNKSQNAFSEAATAFNKCCEVYAGDDDDPEGHSWFVDAMAKLRNEFESIEPIGDPESSLWSATVHDTECGLFSLY